MADFPREPAAGTLAITGGTGFFGLPQISQVVVEALSNDAAVEAEISQVVAEALTENNLDNIFSQLVVELADGSVSPQRIAQFVTEVLYGVSTTQDYSQLVVEYLEAVLAVVDYQVAMPIADVTIVGWTPSTGIDLFACVDKAYTVVDDAVFIESSAGDAVTAEIAMAELNPPASGTGEIRIRLIQVLDE